VGFEDAKELLTVIACANASGTCKCKLLATGKVKIPGLSKDKNFSSALEPIKYPGLHLKYFLTGLKHVLYLKLLL
jgi:hypothetical protein